MKILCPLCNDSFDVCENSVKPRVHGNDVRGRAVMTGWMSDWEELSSRRNEDTRRTLHDKQFPKLLIHGKIRTEDRGMTGRERSIADGKAN